MSAKTKIWLVVKRYDYDGFSVVAAYLDEQKARDLVLRAEEHRKIRPTISPYETFKAWEELAPAEIRESGQSCWCDEWGIEEAYLVA